MSNESDTPTPRTALEQLMSFRHDTFYGREWVLMDDAERLAKQCTQTERELIAANARIAELEAQQPPAPKYLERPDAPGDWWCWNEAGPWWDHHEVYQYDEKGLMVVGMVPLWKGIWTPATPPQWTPSESPAPLER